MIHGLCNDYPVANSGSHRITNQGMSPELEWEDRNPEKAMGTSFCYRFLGEGSRGLLAQRRAQKQREPCSPCGHPRPGESNTHCGKRYKPLTIFTQVKGLWLWAIGLWMEIYMGGSIEEGHVRDREDSHQLSAIPTNLSAVFWLKTQKVENGAQNCNGVMMCNYAKYVSWGQTLRVHSLREVTVLKSTQACLFVFHYCTVWCEHGAGVRGH